MEKKNVNHLQNISTTFPYKILKNKPHSYAQDGKPRQKTITKKLQTQNKGKKTNKFGLVGYSSHIPI